MEYFVKEDFPTPTQKSEQCTTVRKDTLSIANARKPLVAGTQPLAPPKSLQRLKTRSSYRTEHKNSTPALGLGLEVQPFGPWILPDIQTLYIRKRDWCITPKGRYALPVNTTRICRPYLRVVCMALKRGRGLGSMS